MCTFAASKNFDPNKHGEMDMNAKQLIAGLQENPDPAINQLAEYVERLGLEKDRYLTILDTMAEGWWQWEVGSREAYQNPNWFRMLGFAAGEIIPSLDTWMDLMHPDDRETAFVRQQELMDRQDSWELIFRMRAKDGSYRWVLSRGKVAERAANGKAKFVVRTHRDITEQRELERKVWVGESSSLLQRVFQVAPSGFKVYDYLNRRITFSARIMEILYGRRDEDYHILSEDEMLERIHSNLKFR